MISANDHLLLSDSHTRQHIVWFHLQELSRIGESTEAESRSAVARDWGKETVGEGKWLGMGKTYFRGGLKSTPVPTPTPSHERFSKLVFYPLSPTLSFCIMLYKHQSVLLKMYLKYLHHLHRTELKTGHRTPSWLSNLQSARPHSSLFTKPENFS